MKMEEVKICPTKNHCCSGSIYDKNAVPIDQFIKDGEVLVD